MMKMTVSTGNVGGYTCARCQSFVPNGCSHFCPATGQTYPTPSVPAQPTTRVDHGFQYAAALERIASALEQIAKALKARD